MKLKYILLIIFIVAFTLHRPKKIAEEGTLCPDEWLVYVTDLDGGFLKCENYDQFYVELAYKRIANAEKLLHNYR